MAHIEFWKVETLGLARGPAAGDVRARGALLAAADTDAGPVPVGASALATENVDIGRGRGDGTRHLGDGQVRDGDAAGRGAGRAAVLVVLLDHDAVLGNVAEGDARVRDVGHGTGGAVDRLDAHAVLGVDNLGVGDGHGLDGVVGAATHGANGKAVAARAGAAGERDVGAGVDGEAVILVLDICARDVDVLGGADIEGVGVVALAGAGGVVHGHVEDIQVGRRVDAHELYGSVLDVQVLDGGLLERVGIEHLGLGLAAIAAFAVPPLGTVAVDDMARGT